MKVYLPSVSSMPPGAMTFDRIPRGPSSTAITLERASTAALAADTCAWNGVPIDEMLQMSNAKN